MAFHSIVAFILSFVTAAILMRWLLALCHKFCIYERDAERNPTHLSIPRIGGAVFFPSIVAGVLATIVLRIYDNDIADTFHLSTVFIGCGTLAVYLFGILDDTISMSRTLKWFLKVAVCAFFPFCSLTINHLYGFLGLNELSVQASYALTFVTTFLIVETINAADDTDGLAATLALIFVCILGYQFYTLGYYTYAYLAIALAAALLLFLHYNLWGDERIGTKVYMGNCGRLTLGFTLAYLGIKYAMDNKHVMVSRPDALLTVYSLFIVPLFDYVYVTIRALWLGDEISSRRELRFQNLLRLCRVSERHITLAMALWTIWFYAINKWMNYLGLSLTWIVVIDIVVYTIVRFFISYCAKHVGAETDSEAVTHTESVISEKEAEPGLVSVIMPSWNSSKFVAQSIESVLAQTYTNLELIITDDASTDSTPDILRQYAERDTRVRVILNTTNGGAGRSRNCSIQAARGQFIAFCDSDDRWEPTKLQKQIDFMQEKKVALCFCPYYTCGPKNEYLGYVSAPRRVSLFQMMCDNKIGFLTAIYDTSLVGKHLMPAQRKRQDHALLLLLLMRCRHAYSVPEPLAHYRLHPGNMSAKKMGLLRYNAMTYKFVFHWPMPLCWVFLFVFFLPTYFWKRVKNLLINISRTQLG